MDVCGVHGSPAYRCSSSNVEFDIERIAVAVAGLNDKILRLREEIDSLKSEEGGDFARKCSG